MGAIAFVVGDATRPQGAGGKIICHVCNDIGRWGKGFVVAVSRRCGEPEADFRAWHAAGATGDFGLGRVRFVQVEPDVYVANMIAQHGIKGRGSVPPIRYEALAACLRQVAERARASQASVHMPRIGCGLAGGDWSRIEPLIQEHLTAAGIDVTVYDLS